jgi:hypothetical protein
VGVLGLHRSAGVAGEALGLVLERARLLLRVEELHDSILGAGKGRFTDPAVPAFG